VESLYGSPSSVIIWRNSFCARLGSLAGEVGGWRSRLIRLLSGEEGAGPPSCVWGGACASTETGFLFCSSSSVGAVDVVEARNASSAAPPPLMVRMCVGLWREGAYRIRHFMVGGMRSASLGRPRGRLRAVAACRAVVVHLSSRLTIDEISNLILFVIVLVYSAFFRIPLD